MTVENGTPSASRPCTGMTSTPPATCIPCWGEGASNHHASCFNFRVKFSGGDHVTPSSFERTIMNCAAVPISNPGSDPVPVH